MPLVRSGQTYAILMILSLADWFHIVDELKQDSCSYRMRNSLDLRLFVPFFEQSSSSPPRPCRPRQHFTSIIPPTLPIVRATMSSHYRPVPCYQQERLSPTYHRLHPSGWSSSTRSVCHEPFIYLCIAIKDVHSDGFVPTSPGSWSRYFDHTTLTNTCPVRIFPLASART